MAARRKANDKEIIETFRQRVGRVLDSRLIDAAQARLEAGWRFNITGTDGDFSVIARDLPSEQELKALSVDIRPFFPWVDDVTSVSKVLKALERSTTQDEWTNAVRELRSQIGRNRQSLFFKNGWSIPSEGWHKFVTDRELARHVINSIYFHEGIDPQWRTVLLREGQEASNIQAVSRLINETILEVAATHQLLVDIEDAGALEPKD